MNLHIDLRADKHLSISYFVFDVEQKQIAESLGWEGVLLQEELELAEATSGSCLHVHQRLVVESDGVELLFRARRHVSQRLTGRFICKHSYKGFLQNTNNR